jgi:ribose-phosphate pyrophosphokinase
VRVARSGPVLFAFRDCERFARRLARSLGTELRPLGVHRFPDGETLVVAPGRARHGVVVRSLHDPNAKLVEVLLAADALRRAGARRVSLVAPYLGYMRQDAVFGPGQPISQRVIGDLLGRAFDAVLTLEAHLHRVRRLREVIPCRAESLPAAPLVAEWLRGRGKPRLVVGPDEESEPWVREVARLAGLPWVVGRKERLSDSRVRVVLPALPAARDALLYDDIASTGATLASAARALRARRIRSVQVAVVHALFAPGALGRLRRAGVRRVVSCDTVPHRSNAIASAAPFARWLARSA